MQKNKLLLIEPDKTLGNLYYEELTKGFDITYCTNASDALAGISRKLPDIIVLEIMLPEHNGIEVLYDLQSYTESKKIPVVLLSYMDLKNLDINSSQLEQLSVSEIIYKPLVSPKELRKKIENINLVKA